MNNQVRTISDFVIGTMVTSMEQVDNKAIANVTLTLKQKGSDEVIKKKSIQAVSVTPLAAHIIRENNLVGTYCESALDSPDKDANPFCMVFFTREDGSDGKVLKSVTEGQAKKVMRKLPLTEEYVVEYIRRTNKKSHYRRFIDARKVEADMPPIPQP